MTRGGEYDTVGFRELQITLEGRHPVRGQGVKRSQTPPAMPTYWYKHNVPFWVCQKTWNQNPHATSRRAVRDGRWHYTKTHSPRQIKLNPRDPTVAVKRSKTASRILPVVTTSMINGREVAAPGEEGRLGVQPVIEDLRKQCESIKAVKNFYTSNQLMFMQQPGPHVETEHEHLACCIPLYSSFTKDNAFDPCVWQPKRMHTRIRELQQAYTIEPTADEIKRDRIRRGSIIGMDESGSLSGTHDDRAPSAPTPGPGRIGRRGSLSFKVHHEGDPSTRGQTPMTRATTPSVNLRPPRSQSPYVLRAHLNASPFPPKPSVRRDPSDPLPRIGRVISRGDFGLGNLEVPSPPLSPEESPEEQPSLSTSLGQEQMAATTESDALVKNDAFGAVKETLERMGVKDKPMDAWGVDNYRD